MCGIVGYVGSREAVPLLMEGLKRLEYRGYDSAGVATLDAGRLERRRQEGKLAGLEALIASEPLKGTTGIGHTRWATHGPPVIENAHPHQAGKVALVHNGIIENFRPLREEVIAGGAAIATQTDSEVIAHLIAAALADGAGIEATMPSLLARLEGAFALAILIEGADGQVIAARRGSPLVIGLGEGETFLGSDALALAPFTNRVIYLEEGDWAVLEAGGARIFDSAGDPVERPALQVAGGALMVDKAGHRHFMAKEIFEQPEVIAHALGAYIDPAREAVSDHLALPDFTDLDRLVISACGTAYYAGLIARYWFEQLAGLSTDVDIASEFRYRQPALPDRSLGLFISQSGETADTMAAMRYVAGRGLKTVAVVNVEGSTLAREADYVCPIHAGPEIGVASTKAFTCQLTVLAALAIAAGRQRGHLSAARERELVTALLALPREIAEILAEDPVYHRFAQDLSKARDVIYLGRGTLYPIALEGALKLKEISYIHAEGYAAGELKHGPIALIDEEVPVVVIAPHDALFEKTVSNMHEVIARQGQVLLISDAKGVDEAGDEVWAAIRLPTADPLVQPILASVPVQLLAYHTAVLKGTDVDQPRNLAKSVTVE